jgi:hypothetical protein
VWPKCDAIAYTPTRPRLDQQCSLIARTGAVYWLIVRGSYYSTHIVVHHKRGLHSNMLCLGITSLQGGDCD